MKKDKPKETVWVPVAKHDASYPLRAIKIVQVDVAQDWRPAPSMTNTLSNLSRLGGLEVRSIEIFRKGA